MKPNWFVAYPIEGRGWFDALIARTPEGLRTFAVEDLHLTVAFMSGVDEASARRGWAAAVASPPAPVEVSFGPIMPFGNPKQPSAFALTIAQGREAVCEALTGCGAAVLRAASCPPDRYKEPRPHVTVARPPLRPTLADQMIGEAWAGNTEPPVVAIQLDRLALYTWSDDRRNNQFKIVEAIPLRLA